MNIESYTKLSPKKNKMLSYGGIFYGLLFAIIGLSSNEGDTSLFLSTIGILLFAAGIGSILILKKKEQSLISSKFNEIFFELIKEKYGKFTVLDFAIKANIEPKEAREFIENKSIQLGAVTEIDDNGIIYYIFK